MSVVGVASVGLASPSGYGVEAMDMVAALVLTGVDVSVAHVSNSGCSLVRGWVTEDGGSGSGRKSTTLTLTRPGTSRRTLLLSHSHSLSLSHSHSLTLSLSYSLTLSLSHCLSISLCHCLCLSVSLSLRLCVLRASHPFSHHL